MNRDVACGPPSGCPYEPGSLNAKQWLRSLENRECLLLFERGVTMLDVEGGGQEQHLWN